MCISSHLQGKWQLDLWSQRLQVSSVLTGSSEVVAEFPLADEVFGLILELMAVIGVVPYVAVVATILILVPL